MQDYPPLTLSYWTTALTNSLFFANDSGIAGGLAITFGPNNTFPVLHLLYGQKYSKGEAPLALAWYCLYMLLLATNGILESFVHATAHGKQLAQGHVALVSINIAQTVVTLPLVAYSSSLGMIFADSIGMVLRILYCTNFILYQYRPNLSQQQDVDSVSKVSGGHTKESQSAMQKRGQPSTQKGSDLASTQQLSHDKTNAGSLRQACPQTYSIACLGIIFVLSAVSYSAFFGRGCLQRLIPRIDMSFSKSLAVHVLVQLVLCAVALGVLLRTERSLVRQLKVFRQKQQWIVRVLIGWTLEDVDSRNCLKDLLLLEYTRKLTLQTASTSDLSSVRGSSSSRDKYWLCSNVILSVMVKTRWWACNVTSCNSDIEDLQIWPTRYCYSLGQQKPIEHILRLRHTYDAMLPHSVKRTILQRFKEVISSPFLTKGSTHPKSLAPFACWGVLACCISVSEKFRSPPMTGSKPKCVGNWPEMNPDRSICRRLSVSGWAHREVILLFPAMATDFARHASYIIHGRYDINLQKYIAFLIQAAADNSRTIDSAPVSLPLLRTFSQEAWQVHRCAYHLACCECMLKHPMLTEWIQFEVSVPRPDKQFEWYLSLERSG